GASEQQDKIIYVKNLTEASLCLQSLKIDVILLDLRLPDTRGVDAVNIMRRWVPAVPIVVLTDLDDEKLAMACIEAGAQDYISKQEMSAQNLRRSIGCIVARAREIYAQKRADVLQKRLADIVESSADAIFSCDINGMITSWNPGSEKIFGHSMEAAIGKPINAMIQFENGDCFNEQISRSRVIHENETVIPNKLITLKKTGSDIILSMIKFALKDEKDAVIGWAAICRDVTECIRRDTELQKRNHDLEIRDKQMRALAAHLNEIRELERTRISREVHDELGQLLTGIKIDLRWITKNLNLNFNSASVKICKRIAETNKLIDHTIEAVQRIAVELRPSVLDVLGLPAAIRDEARRFESKTGIAVELQVTDVLQVNSDISTEIFRIFQELMTNVARHAEATLVEIIFEKRSQYFCLSVKDNGVGFQIDKYEKKLSLGLLGIQERAEMLKGKVMLKSCVERGTEVIVLIPDTKRKKDDEHTYSG
ncbi:MAG: PAS domain S-box protein, partial [Proteobacteria bacterium]|nr:PAS domain S-box protein [Pseudomonadota bacterium]